MVNNILVLCIGNICRSPIGEILFKQKLMRIAPKVVVTSAGISAMVGWSADPTSQELMLARGVDLSQHVAQQLSKDTVFGHDLILTMDLEQKRQVELMYPSLCGRVHRLGKWSEFDVPDPYKRPKEIFEQCLHLIEQGVDDWIGKLWN